MKNDETKNDILEIQEYERLIQALVVKKYILAAENDVTQGNVSDADEFFAEFSRLHALE